MTLSRRHLLGLITLAACKELCPSLEEGELLEVLPFMDDDGGVPYGESYRAGLLGLKFVDLMQIDDTAPMPTTDEFYVRTMAPPMPEGDWTLEIGGLVEEAQSLTLEELYAETEDQGEVLLECSGNSKMGGYGLLSTALWSGVPLQKLLDRVRPLAEAKLLLFEGWDYSADDGNSKAGCSWIFTPEDVAEAFIATHMNGELLPPDHGAPIRLLTPNRFGCTAVKWLRSIRWVGADEPATMQMQEFASRTHQVGIPVLARDFAPATIEACAMVTRVERWEVSGKQRLRVLGLLWGESAAVDSLGITFNEKDFFPVDLLPGTHRSWRFWSWCGEDTPEGEVKMGMGVLTPGVPARRLESRGYRRTVKV
ncbi:MAG TPA: molybdopterin-dependent oxidoreductase [Myxococcota bacterium]|nr:molybdopterin-dependent oxidoreductase [Myxococcota bacterium]